MSGEVVWTDAEREAVLQVLHDDQCLGDHRVSEQNPPCLYALQNEDFTRDLLTALEPLIAERVRQARAEALREAATAIDAEAALVPRPRSLADPADWLRGRADAEGGQG